MNRKNQNTFQKLTQVSQFATTNVGLFPKSSPAAEIQKQLESGVKELTEQSAAVVSAETAIRLAGNDLRVARDELKTALSRSRRIAETLGTDKIQLSSHPTDRTLLDCGLAFVRDAEGLRKEFAEHGVPVETVAKAVNVLEEAIRSVSSAKASRVVALRLWSSTRDELLEVVRHYDSLVEIFLEENLEATAAYAAARVIPKTGGRKKGKAKAEAPVSTTAADAAA